MAIKQTRREPDDEDLDLQEAPIHFLFNELPCDRSNILELRHHRLFPEQQVERLYMEYARHGDLYHLITRYRRWR